MHVPFTVFGTGMYLVFQFPPVMIELLFFFYGWIGPLRIHDMYMTMVYEKYLIWKRFQMRARRRMAMRMVEKFLGKDCTQVVFGNLDLSSFGNDFVE